MARASQVKVMLVCVFLLTTPQAASAQWDCLFWGVVGGGAAVLAAPFVLTAAGFTTGGIVAGSLGAKAMSVAWTAKVGTGAIAALQSAGAAGLTLGAKATLATVAGAVTSKVACNSKIVGDCDKENN